MRGEATRADNYAALAKRVDMAVDRFHLIESRALDAEQLKMDRQKIFRDDVETRARQEVMDVGDPPRDRILDRNHAERRSAVGDGRERILERRAGQGFPSGIDVVASNMGIGARLALVGDLVDGHPVLESIEGKQAFMARLS